MEKNISALMASMFVVIVLIPGFANAKFQVSNSSSTISALCEELIKVNIFPSLNSCEERVQNSWIPKVKGCLDSRTNLTFCYLIDYHGLNHSNLVEVSSVRSWHSGYTTHFAGLLDFSNGTHKAAQFTGEIQGPPPENSGGGSSSVCLPNGMTCQAGYFNGVPSSASTACTCCTSGLVILAGHDCEGN